jgi:anti-anti-sigma factor
LDIATVSEVDHALRRAEAAASLVVFDLRGLDFVDSCGAHLILAADRRIRRAGGRLVIVRGSLEVQWLFALMGLDRELELVDEPPGRELPARADASAMLGDRLA